MLHAAILQHGRRTPGSRPSMPSRALAIPGVVAVPTFQDIALCQAHSHPALPLEALERFTVPAGPCRRCGMGEPVPWLAKRVMWLRMPRCHRGAL
jgi:hypothetical protein